MIVSSMTLLDSIRVLLLIFLVVVTTATKTIHEYNLPSRKSFEAICKNITKEPFFDYEGVMGKPWNVYFSWNMKLDEFCMELTFKYANVSVVNRMKNDIKGLKIESPSDNPVLALSVSLSPDMLLFKDRSGIPGWFIGVPDVDEHFAGEKLPPVPHKMALKLLEKGRYLHMSDCSFGTTSLSLRRDNRPKRTEINAFAANFTIGDPFPACINEEDPDKK